MSHSSPAVSALHSEIVAECQHKMYPQPGVVGAVGASIDLSKYIPALVKTSLDLAVQVAGDQVESFVHGQKDLIKSVISDKVLEFVDGLVHDLQGSRPVMGGEPE